jgi:hypothetical protein
MFPTFKINEVTNTENSLELTGRISSDSFNGHKWVDDKWVGSLKVNDSIVFGRWHKQNNDWKFAVDQEDSSKADFYVGQEVALIDGYWGERVELVVDKSINWKEATFSATERNNHDHCLICWATISEFENKRYMLANERVAVCLNCFENYIKQNSFDFIAYPEESFTN